MYYIYRITNTVNGKVYIGQTIRHYKERFKSYERLKTNDHLKNSFLKYGIDLFTFEVIDQVEDLDELNCLEIKYIQQYDSTNRDKGYNIESGGRNAPASAETRKKMSIVRLGKKHTDEWTQNRIYKAGTEGAKKYGHQLSDAEKRYLSESNSGENNYWHGKTRDAETKRKISQAKTGISMSEETKKAFLEKAAKKVEMIAIDGCVTIFESQTAAGLAMGISTNTISGYCHGKFKNKKGLIFKYV